MFSIYLCKLTSFLSFALWSTTQNTSVLATGPASSRLSLVSGEVGCQREVRVWYKHKYMILWIFTKVRVVAVGGGGGSTPYRAGGGSGQVTGEPQLDI